MEGGDGSDAGRGHPGVWGEGIVQGFVMEEVIQVCGGGGGESRGVENFTFNRRL